MKYVNKKYESVPILSIMKDMDENSWNRFLNKCLIGKDVELLVATRYGLQLNMSELAKGKVVDNNIVTLFIRLTMSIEKTLKKIFRNIYINPNYDPELAKKYPEFRAEKKNLDEQFELFLRERSY